MTSRQLFSDAPAGLRLRTEVCHDDCREVARLVSATDMFSAEETQIAVELVSERLAKGDASGYRFFILEDEQGWAGYVCYGLIPCTTTSFDLYWIVVDPARHRQGLGRYLVRRAETAAQALGGKAMYIDTSGQEKYTPTRQFYERCGYEVAARLADFYAVGDAKCIYRRWFAGCTDASVPSMHLP